MLLKIFISAKNKRSSEKCLKLHTFRKVKVETIDNLGKTGYKPKIHHNF